VTSPACLLLPSRRFSHQTSQRVYQVVNQNISQLVFQVGSLVFNQLRNLLLSHHLNLAFSLFRSLVRNLLCSHHNNRLEFQVINLPHILLVFPRINQHPNQLLNLLYNQILALPANLLDNLRYNQQSALHRSQVCSDQMILQIPLLLNQLVFQVYSRLFNQVLNLVAIHLDNFRQNQVASQLGYFQLYRYPSLFSYHRLNHQYFQQFHHNLQLIRVSAYPYILLFALELLFFSIRLDCTNNEFNSIS
jgi:hypothetical protein